jgi:hypothetical protein
VALAVNHNHRSTNIKIIQYYLVNALFTRAIKTRLYLVLLCCLVLPAVSIAGPALWQVKSNTATVYLFGSIHVADKSIYPLDSKIERAFKQSDVLVVEVDETQADQVKLNNLMLTKGFYPMPETVESHVNKETFDLLQDFLKKTAIPYAAVARMRPGIIAITLTVARLQQLGYSPELGIDRYFMKKARSAGKPIEQLETATDQLNLLLSFSNEDLLLKHTIISLNEMKDVFGDIVTAWKTGNTKKIEQLMLNDPISEYPEFESLMDRLFDQRNKTMTNGIVKLLKKNKTCFVVVGAGHMVSDKGIVSLLQKRGYSVKRI